MDNGHNVSIDQQSKKAQLAARIAVGKLLRIGYSERRILKLMKNTVEAYKSMGSSEGMCSQPCGKESGNIHG
jgi:hypothetical protein